MQDELLLTIPESAQRQKISVRHHWALIAAGKFGPDLLRLGRSVRIRAAELADWLTAGAPPRETWARMRSTTRNEKASTGVAEFDGEARDE